MEKAKVALLQCGNYEEENVYQAIRQGLALLGGLGQFVRPEENILLKPNLLKGAAPEKAITTHPAVFSAVLRCLREEGYTHLTYGDSPAAAFDAQKTAVQSGLTVPAEKYGAEFGDFSGAEPTEYPAGKTAKKFMFAREVVKADAIISLCKMKTHALENITGAMKNQYGCIFGPYKAAGHAAYPNAQSFADMMADMNRCLGVRLFIMDGILAMEGNGPSSGDPKLMKVLLLSADPVALDSVFAHLVHLDPHHVPTCVSGAREGLGKMEADEITVLTPEGELTVDEAAAKYGDPTFAVKRKNTTFWHLRSLLPTARHYTDRPVPDPDKCIACGLCQQSCPVEGAAVHSGQGQKAVYDYKKRIRCYCCQEVCPVGAISRQ